MRAPKYPLEALATLRAERVDQASADLSGAAKARALADTEQRAAGAQRAEHEQTAARVREVERGALELGELCAADLARGHAWELRVAAEQRALAEREALCRAAAAAACDKEQQARSELAARRSEADVVDRDRARWAEGRRRSAEAAEEEAAAEAARPRP